MTTPDLYVVVVTGSRTWAGYQQVLETLEAVEVRAGGRPVMMLNGKCDPYPRNPGGSRRHIPWDQAVQFPDRMQRRMRGADWLSYLAGRELAWQIELRQARWWGPCRLTCTPGHRRRYRYSDTFGFCPAAGDYRNTDMIGEAVAAGAGRGAGEVDAFLDVCPKDQCRIAGVHPSHGTAQCVREARKAGLTVYPHCVPELEQVTL